MPQLDPCGGVRAGREVKKVAQNIIEQNGEELYGRTKTERGQVFVGWREYMV